jgi:16S rRNA G966 N2-methylase RsmD
MTQHTAIATGDVRRFAEWGGLCGPVAKRIEGDEMQTTTWQEAYDENWKGLITDESFAHPAKMSRGLIVRIFDHLFARGWLQPGGIVVDPFGGIGSTGIEAASRGCRAFLCELEPRFVDLAKANFELHRRTWEACGDPLPVIVQGDSRRLCEVLGPVMADCVVGSPPFLGAHAGCATDEETRQRANAGLLRRSGTDYTDYGQTPGQLGAMPPGNVADCIVSSPPYEGCLSSRGDMDRREAVEQKAATVGGAKWGRNKDGSASNDNYGSDENIGNNTGETFWTAAREIVQQCHQILRPGGVAVWVCKDFVRKGSRVPFSADWLRLCEACGFEPVEWIKASLVKETAHPSLFDDEPIVERTERKSFFRRLAEKKGSPRIDHEDVLIVRKPAIDTDGQ